MTIYELVSQLHGLSVGGYFNDTKMTTKQLRNYITSMFRAGGNQIVMRISLPDGRWFFTITQYEPGEFDYYIPDTREQETRIKNIIGA